MGRLGELSVARRLSGLGDISNRGAIARDISGGTGCGDVSSITSRSGVSSGSLCIEPGRPIENNPRGAGCRLCNTDSFDQVVTDFTRGHAAMIYPWPCAHNVEEKPVRIVRAVCVKFRWSASVNNDPRGTWVGKRPKVCNLNYAGIRCGDHGQDRKRLPPSEIAASYGFREFCSTSGRQRQYTPEYDVARRGPVPLAVQP